MSLDVENVPELVPARMVNEFTYCQRLFYLEWVQAQFAESADTVDGDYQHRVVDVERGRAPDPDAADGLRQARSVLVSAPLLGLIGRIDLLEGEDGAVVPVDVKRGSPADTPERVWEPERRQVAVHALMLREAGYVVPRAELYFAQTRQRIVVELSDELMAQTIAAVARMRELALVDVAPDPLVDSPKCPRCSLVGICLPDEHNLLRSRSERKPRRLTPTDDSARPLYVTEAGASVTVRSGRMEVHGRPDRNLPGKPPRRATVRLIDISQVCACSATFR